MQGCLEFSGVLCGSRSVEHRAGLAGGVVVMADTAASMSAIDFGPDRLAAAKAAAIDALKDLPSGAKVSVIEAGRTARIVATGTSDISRVRQAIGSIKPTVSRGDLGDAPALAPPLAVPAREADGLVA